MESNNKAPHILNTSATLFGLCYVVLTSLKALKVDRETLMDEFTTVSMFLFITSCLLSFLSIRGKGKSAVYERMAEYVFLGGLLALFVTTIFIVFNVIH
jgi:hypothetical protein